jgi:hypothetical protein
MPRIMFAVAATVLGLHSACTACQDADTERSQERQTTVGAQPLSSLRSYDDWRICSPRAV